MPSPLLDSLRRRKTKTAVRAHFLFQHGRSPEKTAGKETLKLLRAAMVARGLKPPSAKTRKEGEVSSTHTEETETETDAGREGRQ
jgi:hypothetical protein